MQEAHVQIWRDAARFDPGARVGDDLDGGDRSHRALDELRLASVRSSNLAVVPLA